MMRAPTDIGHKYYVHFMLQSGTLNDADIVSR